MYGPLFSMTHSARSPMAASVISERKVVHQIPRTCSVFRVHLSTAGQARTLQLQHLRPQKIQMLDEFLQLRVKLRLVCPTRPKDHFLCPKGNCIVFAICVVL
jgi:hypothetical protein